MPDFDQFSFVQGFGYMLEKMRAYRASKAAKNPKPKRTIIINNQPQPQPVQPIPQVQSVQKQPKARKKAPQQFHRVPQQVVKDYIPMYKSPNATPISDTSISTYLSQFKKVYEHFTKKMYQSNLKMNL